MKDYYYILGLGRSASKDEIRKAYWKLSLKFHPDQNNGDKFWEARFRDIHEAYETLVDNEKRKDYDEKMAAKADEYSNNHTQDKRTEYNQDAERHSAPPPSQAPAGKQKKPTKWFKNAGSIFLVLFVIAQVYRASAIYSKESAADTITNSFVSPSASDSTAEPIPLNVTEANKDEETVTKLSQDSNLNVTDTPSVTETPSDGISVYEVRWKTGSTQYRSALLLKEDGTGIMRVKYFDGEQVNIIEESFKSEGAKNGTRLKGYNPVYANTQTICANYSPDNFLMPEDEDGNVTIICVDDSGQTSTCTVNAITGYSDEQTFLADFSWKLDE